MSDMSTEPETTRGKRLTVSLSSLYLDANNFRFIDHPDYRQVEPEHVFDAEVQRRTTGFVLGRAQANVGDLIASIKENGWLDIDPILARRQSRGRYLVVEGNRRVATLKYLHRRYQDDAIDLGNLDPTVFAKVPILLYDDADERHHLVMMGLHHISGKRRWPAINRAEAMRRLYGHFDQDADAVCRALGVSKREFNLSVRTLALVEEYRHGDYGDQFQPDQYNLFREVLKSPAIREWLRWDHATCTASSSHNLERLFSWMSRESEGADDEAAETPEVGMVTSLDPAITTGGQIRELAKIIEDPNAVKRLEETRSLQEATLSSDLLVKSEIEGALEACDRGISRLHSRTGQLRQGDLDRVDQLIGKLQGVALAHKRQPLVAGRRLPWQPFNELTRCQFDSIEVDSYRGIDGVVLEDLGRVNLLVGVNNAGKTSLLEAVYLLAHQNDERALLDLIRWRGRIEVEPDVLWTVDQLPRSVRLAGSFDEVGNNLATVDIETATEPNGEIEDQTYFLASLTIESDYALQSQNTSVVFFEDRPRRTSFQGQHWLCRSAFSSPFSAHRPETLARSNKASLEAGTKEKIVDFIRRRIDPGLRNIELADKFNRFLVSHDDFDKAPDLATFGEGVRRVFEIGLLFADVRGGVVLIDEFENAIHTELLRDFTRFVQELAVELDVQVFLSTHSKETIDAFLDNDYRIEDIAGYALIRGDHGVSVRRYDGAQLLRLHDAVDFDLRGIR